MLNWTLNIYFSFDICISVYALLLLICLYLQQMQQAEHEDNGEGGDFYYLIGF